MKILHTSDWHLGHRLLEQSQFDEQSLYLTWLLEFIAAQNIDIVLVSGDLFDTGVPSSQGQKLYYDFLIHLKNTNCKYLIVTGGNHDAPSTINAPKELLQALSIHVVGKATENIEDEVFKLEVNGEEIIIAAVPYLRDQDIRRAIAGEDSQDIKNRYKTALINHYNEAAAHCQKLKSDNTVAIAMGHLFAVGGVTSDSEQTIYVGNLGDIGANDFPSLFDYVALGHLHKAQQIGAFNNIRYSGSPYMLSFSEANSIKKMVVIETQYGKIADIKEVDVPKFREITRIMGTVESCIHQLEILDKNQNGLTPWVEVVLENDQNYSLGYPEITKAAEQMSLEVLKVTLKNERKIAGLESLIENAKHIKELTPIDVFKLKCKELNVDLDNDHELLNAFYEILQMSQEGQ
jgi:exonuclease SbcD